MERSETAATFEPYGRFAKDAEFPRHLSQRSRDSTLTHLHLIRGLLLATLDAVREHRFGLSALLIPLGIRAVPEIVVGPYPMGFDTMASYVPNTLDWAMGKIKYTYVHV